ncbi:hypothetical protein [Bacteroidetes bacterium endosymbiont of Geopemphigus sp.]|uniref:hypothetical protein n=1 Tax=Bacteroidetes bacterium endosymbiont of Geopemphigus sp. TaxID=2047937 RepID=UPI000CD0CBA6|nr:hypothetical protein [Bacteroidetes bacterium endosymbiont of Geopemphigus sp.]
MGIRTATVGLINEAKQAQEILLKERADIFYISGQENSFAILIFPYKLLRSLAQRCNIPHSTYAIYNLS